MSKDKEASKAVLEYLNTQNRPYSAVDIFNNLKNKCDYGKTLVVKTLEELTKTGKIKEKVYGKQKVYCADQGQFPIVKDEELKQLDSNINELKEKLSSSKQMCKKLDSEVSSLNGQMKTEEMDKQLVKYTEECNQIEERVKKMKSQENHISPEEKEKIYSKHRMYAKEWRCRKKMASEMLDAILEGYPKSKKALYDDIGIETDEDCGVKPPQA